MRKCLSRSIYLPAKPPLQWGRTLSSAEVLCVKFDHSSSAGASMGPHSFKCGSWASGEQKQWNNFCFNGAALFQVRKFLDFLFYVLDIFVLQWGRTLSSAEVLVLRLARCPPAMLQWGRTLSSAEVATKGSSIKTDEAASMGPHSFKCGSLVRPGLPQLI